MNTIQPPLVLDCARVLAYAFVDDSVVYSERGTFFVGGKVLGPVPRLAICQNIGETELMVFHCDNEWNVLGVAGGHIGVEEAKESVERSYHGLKDKWVDTGVTEEQAAAHLEREFGDVKCSFCGRWPLHVERMIGTDVRICNLCVEKFYRLLH